MREFKLPDLGEGIHEGEIIAIKVKVGDVVQENQPILEVETDKAAVEIPSPYTGVVTAIQVKPGDTVRVGQTLVTFEEGLAPQPAVMAPAAVTMPVAPAAIPVPVVPPSAVAPVSAPERTGPVPASPATRRLARELGVDLRQVPGTGPAGLVTAEDVRQFAARLAQPAVAPATPPVVLPATPPAITPPPLAAPVEMPPVQPAAPPLPVDREERVPLRSVRRSIARQMALSWSQVPHVTTQDLADITRLEEFRADYQAEVAARGGKLTLTVFAVKALVAALKEFPRFNASLELEREEIVLKRYYHIGVATDTERGLLVPVLRDADRQSIVELAVALTALAQRARTGQATLEELHGSTMTITNIGALGGTGFTPIINYPEVAILGLAQARWQPVARQKTSGKIKFVPRLMLPVILTFDHRVNDGAEAARFVNRFMELLADPERLLLGL